MTLTVIDNDTGEVLDVEEAERRASYICTDLDHIAESFEGVMAMLREAIGKRDDVALGYRSPSDYISDRFGGRLSRLGVDLRREVVRELTEAGMSTRSIAPVLGVSKDTVQRDQLAGVSHETPAPDPVAEAEAPDSAESVAVDASVSAQSEGEVNRPGANLANGGDAPRPPVTGIDGKTYAAPVRKPPKPVLDGDLAERANAEQASQNLARAVAKLLEFDHPNMRAGMRRYWDMASSEVPPAQRADVTPEQMRVAAHGLLALADEWTSR